jgi:translation initiation factor 3 subunit E
MADYDLSKTIIPYLDRHLTLAILDYLAETSLFPVKDVQAAQYEIAKNTNMVDYAVTLFGKLHPGEEVPAGVFFGNLTME